MSSEGLGGCKDDRKGSRFEQKFCLEEAELPE